MADPSAIAGALKEIADSWKGPTDPDDYDRDILIIHKHHIATSKHMAAELINFVKVNYDVFRKVWDTYPSKFNELREEGIDPRDITPINPDIYPYNQNEQFVR